MIALLRTGDRVHVAKNVEAYSRTLMRRVCDHIVTPDGRIINGWRVLRFERDDGTPIPHDWEALHGQTPPEPPEAA